MGNMLLTQRSVNELGGKAAALLDTLDLEKSPIVITQDGTPRAVLQDFQSYRESENTMKILNHLVEGERDVHSGLMTEQEAVFEEIERDFFPDGEI